MKRVQQAAAAALLFATTMPTCAHAAAGTNRAQALRYITSAERGWSSSNPNEVTLVKQIIADDFVWLLDGKVLGKSDAISEAKSKPTGTQHFDYVRVRFFGDMAIAQGQQTVTRRNRSKIRNLFMDTWLLRGGKWQIVAATDVDIKE